MKDILLHARAKKKDSLDEKTRINILNLEEQQGHRHLNNYSITHAQLMNFVTVQIKTGPVLAS
jgi:hypothetical protein